MYLKCSEPWLEHIKNSINVSSINIILSKEAGKDTENRANITCINYKEKSKYILHACQTKTCEIVSSSQ